MRRAAIPPELEGRLRSLPDGLDFLLRPVRAGMCRYESLKDGTLSLEDIAVMVTFLDNEAHNVRELHRMKDYG